MWPYSWTHVGTPSHLGHMDRVTATMPSQAHAGAAQEAPNIGQWEGQDVPLVRPSSCTVKGGIPSSRRYLPTYLPACPPGMAGIFLFLRPTSKSPALHLQCTEIFCESKQTQTKATTQKGSKSERGTENESNYTNRMYKNIKPSKMKISPLSSISSNPNTNDSFNLMNPSHCSHCSSRTSV